jgi:hypothetical protein
MYIHRSCSSLISGKSGDGRWSMGYAGRLPFGAGEGGWLAGACPTGWLHKSVWEIPRQARDDRGRRGSCKKGVCDLGTKRSLLEDSILRNEPNEVTSKMRVDEPVGRAVGNFRIGFFRWVRPPLHWVRLRGPMGRLGRGIRVSDAYEAAVAVAQLDSDAALDLGRILATWKWVANEAESFGVPGGISYPTSIKSTSKWLVRTSTAAISP